MILLFTENSSSAQFFIKNKENKFLPLINTSSPRIHVVFSPVALIRARDLSKTRKKYIYYFGNNDIHLTIMSWYEKNVLDMNLI